MKHALFVLFYSPDCRKYINVKTKKKTSNHLFSALQQVYDKVQNGEYVELLIA